MKASAGNQRGLSLIELMIAMTIGLVLLAGLVTVFSNASQSQREMQKAAQQIESGRFAMDTVTQDLHVAGYYGQYGTPASGTALPDPCATGDEAALQSAMAFPVQAIRAASLTATPLLTGTSCAALLGSLNPGSDILVIRRAGTQTLAVGSASVSQEVYLQANPAGVVIKFGNGATMTSTSAADGSAATLTKRDGTAADIRKYHVHIYFVATCSVPYGGNQTGTCTGSTDDQGRPIPTLKRLELGVDAGTRRFTIFPIAEGIEYFKVEYGIDANPTTRSANTGLIGDGVPDTPATAPTAADHLNLVTAKVFLLARNTELSGGYTNSKTYVVGGYVLGSNASEQTTTLSAGPFNDSYKRHAYSSEVRIVNMGSRRERPGGT